MGVGICMSRLANPCPTGGMSAVLCTFNTGSLFIGIDSPPLLSCFRFVLSAITCTPGGASSDYL